MLAFEVSLVPGGLSAVQFVLLGSLAAALVSMAKAGFGGSLGLLATPIMIYACGQNTRLALGIMLPILIACDQVSIVGWWRRWDLRQVGMLLPGAVLGVLIGSAAAWGIEQVGEHHRDVVDLWMKRGIGIIALGFVTLQVARWLRKHPLTFRPVFWQGTAAGATAGFTSTLAHAGGPVVSMYLLPQGMPKARYVATTVLYYWAGNLIKLPPYILLGWLNYEALGGCGLLLPAVGGGALLGLLLHRLVGERSFTGIVYTLLALAGVDLLAGDLLRDALRAAF